MLLGGIGGAFASFILALFIFPPALVVVPFVLPVTMVLGALFGVAGWAMRRFVNPNLSVAGAMALAIAIVVIAASPIEAPRVAAAVPWPAPDIRPSIEIRGWDGTFWVDAETPMGATRRRSGPTGGPRGWPISTERRKGRLSSWAVARSPRSSSFPHRPRRGRSAATNSPMVQTGLISARSRPCVGAICASIRRLSCASASPSMERATCRSGANSTRCAGMNVTRGVSDASGAGRERVGRPCDGAGAADAEA